MYLKQKGYIFDIYEKNKDIFLGSSGYNQFRAHEGFHYPRSSKTIEEIKKNSKLFKERYKKFIKYYKKNLYCISSDESFIDFNSYLSLVRSQKLKFKIINKINNLKNIEGCLSCHEGIILNDKVKKYFNKNLKDKLIFNKKITKDSKELRNYLKILDFTNADLFKNFKQNPKKILTISLIYKEKNNKKKFPITIMDGEHPSLYPYSNFKNLWTLTHAKYTHVKKFEDSFSLSLYKKKIKKNKIKIIRKKMENDMIKFYPNFLKDFKYKSFFWSSKAIVDSKSAERYIYTVKNKNILSIYSPKILNIFSAEKLVDKFLNE
jgi:D-amino-acid oxidase